MVSAYDVFRRRKIKIFATFAVPAILFAVGYWLHDPANEPRNRVLMIAFILSLFLCILLGAYAFHCPRCGRRINAADTPDNGYISFPGYCANCGLDFMSVDIHNNPI